VLLKGNADPLSPLFQTFTVKGVVDHGIYEKDLRYAYVPSENLKKILGLSPQQYNLVLARGNVLFNSNNKKSSEDKLWIIKPSWKEFSPLIEAVEIEKKSIALILQVIVIVAVFNITGFLIAMRLQKAQEVFLLRSLGLSFRQLFTFTMVLLLVLWAFSTATSWVMVQLLDVALVNLSLFQLPGDIYVLSRLSLKLDRFAYGLVFFLTLVWIFLISAPSLWRWSKQSVLSGLREEFK
jgi:ABC-type lipoprotein release transport system permease subunit